MRQNNHKYMSREEDKDMAILTKNIVDPFLWVVSYSQGSGTLVHILRNTQRVGLPTTEASPSLPRSSVPHVTMRAPGSYREGTAQQQSHT